MSQLLAGLSEQQLTAVTAKNHALVTACPGSGKTRVLSVKTIHILEDSNTTVAAVTFTKDSATELRARVLSMSNGDIESRIHTGTFHSLALQQLKEHKALSGFRIMSPGEQFVVLRRAWMPYAETITLDDAIVAIDAIKAKMSPILNSSDPGADVYKSYQAILASERRMDFADLLLRSVQLMQDGSLPPLPVTHMLVDEAQDMDEVQYQWICCHSNNNSAVTLVGDDDQSIYGWRHAMGYEGLMQFVHEHRATQITLATNYRSDKSILEYSGRLIAVNTSRVEKKMRANSSEDGVVKVRHFSERMDEAEAAVESIDRNSNETWGILSRTNQRLDMVELALTEEQIPYARVGGKSFWEKPDPATFLGLLSAIDKDTFLGIANALAWAGITEDKLEIGKSEKNLLKRLKLIDNDLKQDIEFKAQRRTLASFIKLLPEWQAMLQKKRAGLVATGAAVWMSSFAGENKEVMLARCAETVGKLSGTLTERIKLLLSKENKETDKIVTLMTIHSSKGLEFDHVWILGFENGVIPHRDGVLDEERRLAYVAMTRARHELTISYQFSGTTAPSRFLDEAGLR